MAIFSTGNITPVSLFAHITVTSAVPASTPLAWSCSSESTAGLTPGQVNYIDVGYYSQHTDKTNSFQLVLIERADQHPGDFDIEFNYARIAWETGDASGGLGGLGGTPAAAVAVAGPVPVAGRRRRG